MNEISLDVTKVIVVGAEFEVSAIIDLGLAVADETVIEETGAAGIEDMELRYDSSTLVF